MGQEDESVGVEEAVRTATEFDQAYRSPGGKRHISDVDVLRAVLHEHPDVDAWEVQGALLAAGIVTEVGPAVFWANEPKSLSLAHLEALPGRTVAEEVDRVLQYLQFPIQRAECKASPPSLLCRFQGCRPTIAFTNPPRPKGDRMQLDDIEAVALNFRLLTISGVERFDPSLVEGTTTLALVEASREPAPSPEPVTLLCEATADGVACEAYTQRPEQRYEAFFQVKDGLVRSSRLDPQTGDFAVVDPQPPKVWNGLVRSVVLDVGAVLQAVAEHSVLSLRVLGPRRDRPA